MLNTFLRSATYENPAYYFLPLLYQAEECKHITFQWVPSLSGVIGNEAADAATRIAYYNSVQDAIPVSRSEGNTVSSTLVKYIVRRLWITLNSFPRDCLLGLKLRFTAASGLFSVIEGGIHRPRLGVAHIFQYRNAMSQTRSTNCDTCGTEDIISHVPSDCEKGKFEYASLIHAVV